ALGHALATLAIGLGAGHVGAEAVARDVAFHRLFKARDDVAVAVQDRQRLVAVLRRLHRFAALLRDGVVEADDAVFFDLHGQWVRKRGTRPLVGMRGLGQDADRWARTRIIQ